MFYLLSLQSDVDNDLVGDSCDTNQDRYGMPPNCKETGGRSETGNCQRFLLTFALGSLDGSGFCETEAPPLLQATVSP